MRPSSVIVVASLVLGGVAESRPPRPCPKAVRVLMKADGFESRSGLGLCLPELAHAFVELYRARDVSGFRALTEKGSAAAKLYGLCGLESLRVADAPRVRSRLSKSDERTSISAGDELGGPEGSLSKLLAFRDGGSPFEFNTACALLAHGADDATEADLCDPKGPGARLTCR
jgi:hypothetical protein